MTPFTVVSGPAVPLMLNNIDTDVIIRIDRLIDNAKEALAPYTLESLRYLPDGSADPEMVLNKPEFHNAPILIADLNFGCGSSREGAVWALQALGVRCVIAVSYGDIFYSNCFQNGVLPIRIPQDQVTALAALTIGGSSFTVNLVDSLITGPDGSEWPFTIQHLLKEGLVEGLDPIGLTLKRRDAIDAWEQAEVQLRPWNCMAGIEA